MVPYFVCTIATMLLGSLEQFLSRRRPRTLPVLVAILPMCVLAGARSLGIGVDVLVYALPSFNAARLTGLGAFMRRVSIPFATYGVEPLYALLVWLSARISEDVSSILFLTQLLTALPVAVALRRTFPQGFAVGLGAYSMLFMPLSLNIMRQSIAMGFVLLAVAEALLGHGRVAFAWVLVATGFHLTAVAGVLLVALVLHSTERGAGLLAGRVGGVPLWWVVVFLGELWLVVWTPSWLPVLAVLKRSYAYQVAHMGTGDTYNSVVVLALVLLAANRWLPRPAWGSDETALRKVDLLVFVTALGALACQMSVFSPQMGRLGYYLLYPSALAFAGMWESVSRTRGRVALALTMAAILPAFFVVCWGRTEMVPYASRLLPLG